MDGLFLAPRGPLLVLLDDGETGQALSQRLGDRCSILCFPASDWERELTPWPAPGLGKGKADFGGDGQAFLQRLLRALPLAQAASGRDFPALGLMGYSLGGLFALWAGTQTDAFSLLASVSGSLWFDGWTEFLRQNPCRARRVDLSLGQREPNARDARMRTVGDATVQTEALLREQGVSAALTWNPGGHFTDPLGRMEAALSRLLDEN